MTKQTSEIERISAITAEAEKVFGDIDKAREWLTRNNLALGSTPLAMLATETGTNEVSKVLNAIAYGGVI